MSSFAIFPSVPLHCEVDLQCEKLTSAVGVKMSIYNSAGLLITVALIIAVEITAPLSVQSVQAFLCLLCCVPFYGLLCFLDAFH